MGSPKFYQHLILSILVTSGMMLSLGACVPATGTPEPACAVEDLVAPTNLWPGDLSTPGDIPVLDTLTPTFTWEFYGGCQPDNYRVEIHRPYLEHSMDGITANFLDMTSWTADPALLPGSMYSWFVNAEVSGSLGPASETGLFMTGPLCMDPYPSEYPAPILLGPDDGEVITSGSDITYSDGTTTPTVTFNMIWDDPSLCLPEGGYNIQVSDSPDFPDDWAHTLNFTQDYRTFALFFFPPGSTWVECIPYYWHVQADLPGSVDGPFSETRFFIINIHGLDCDAVPIPVPTSTPMTLFANLKQNASCRSGPTLDHPVLDFLMEGSTYRIDGRNQDSTWWWIFDEKINNHCWVSNNVVDDPGAADDVVVITPIPPPVQESTDTPVPGPIQGCLIYENPQSQNLICVYPCPFGANPGTPCTMP